MGRLAQVGFIGLLALPFAVYVAPGCDGGEGSGSGTTVSTGTTMSSGTAGTAAGGAGGEGAGGAGGASTGSAGGLGPPTMVGTCQGKIYQCGDLVDNDGDGKLDYQDPDCLGPCDNTETGFNSGIPGGESDACSPECYFDQDSGAGNDDCRWNRQCDPHQMAPDFDPAGPDCPYNMNANTPGTSKSCSELYAEQSSACTSFCGPLTPNGCDCFGCCELPPGSGSFVYLGSQDDATGAFTCTLDVLADPDKCRPCQPVDGCLNGCGKCELCLGKDTLPPECFPDGGMGGAGGGGDMQCPVGVQPCGLAGQAECPVNAYCITGCCQVIPS